MGRKKQGEINKGTLEKTQKKRKQITIREVANEAKCSISAVSIVLNGKGECIPLTTQQRIFNAVKKLNYKPNVSARTMVTRKSNIVGIILPDVSNQFFAELVRYIQLELNSYGYDVILCNSEDRAESDVRYLNFLSGRKVDGILIAPGAESLEEQNKKNFTDALEQTGVPYLFLDRYLSGDYPKVSVDNEYSGYIAVKHLIENGHKNIGLITGPLVLNSSENRLKGAKQALKESDLPFDESLVYVSKYDLESGRLGAEKLLNKQVSAIFAFSDVQAYGVIQYAKEVGINIPEDLSLIGFDDIFYSSLLDVPLTTMRQPIADLAKESCRSIVKMMEMHDRNEVVQTASTTVVSQLIKRKSVKNINNA